MLVPILRADGQLAEWAMVEIQGRLESLTGEEITEIGTLHVSPTVRALLISVKWPCSHRMAFSDGVSLRLR